MEFNFHWKTFTSETTFRVKEQTVYNVKKTVYFMVILTKSTNSTQFVLITDFYHYAVEIVKIFSSELKKNQCKILVIELMYSLCIKCIQ